MADNLHLLFPSFEPFSHVLEPKTRDGKWVGPVELARLTRHF